MSKTLIKATIEATYLQAKLNNI